MESRAHALAAGIFTLLLGLACALAVFWLSGQRQAMREYILVSKGNVSGLNTQAQVRYRGIRAGKVRDIALDPNDPRNILITIAVDARLPLTRGTTARLEYQGLTGLAAVLLEDKGEDPQPLLGEGDEPPRIVLQPNFMDNLGENAVQLMTQVRQVAERANALLAERNVERIGRILTDVEAASASLNASLKALPQVVASLRQALGDENVKRLGSTLANLERASGDAAPLLAGLRNVTDKLDAVLAETGGELSQITLPRLNALLQELAANSRQMARLLQQIEESPNMLIFGRDTPRPGPGEAGFAMQ
jgi:phospholipid/cholesterol/gamma-HCH transport system substrate-binding protein